MNNYYIYIFFFQMKKAIVLTARVHPGETNSSWMMKGFLDFLTSSSGDAKVSLVAFDPWPLSHTFFDPGQLQKASPSLDVVPIHTVPYCVLMYDTFCIDH